MDVDCLAPGEYWVQCPYNKSHRIINRKQITHLDKCRKQYEKEEKAKGRTPEIVACRFNFSHRFHKVEIALHEKECPDQYAVIHAMTSGNDGAPKLEPRVEQEPNRPVAPEVENDGEDWDAPESSSGQRGYDPSKKLKEGCYLVTKPGLTKSEKKNLREENRKKWIKEQEKQAAPAANTNFDWDEEDF